MARRRLLTILASTLAAGLLALPASALPVVGETSVDEPVESVADPIEEAVVGDVDSAESAEDDSDDSLLLTGEGEILEPLAPLIEPVEDALEPVSDPVEDALDPAEPVEDAVDQTFDSATGDSGSSTTDPGIQTPSTPGSSAAPAGSNDTAVRDAEAPAAPVTAERQSFQPYWSPRSAGTARTNSDTTPEVAAPVSDGVEAPQVAPDQATLAVGPSATDTSSEGLAALLKLFAAFLVAGTGYTWTRVNGTQKLWG